jgi:hypothetical protein
MGLSDGLLAINNVVVQLTVIVAMLGAQLLSTVVQ